MINEKLASIHLNGHSVKRLELGHPWIFSNEIETNRSAKGVEAGAVVDVIGFDSRFVGKAYYNPHSLIALRILSRNKDQEINQLFFEERITRAVKQRLTHYGRNSPSKGTFRAVFGEPDGLPGLVVDRFEGAWVVEPHAFGAHACKAMIIPAIEKIARELLEEKEVNIAYRTDSRSATLEKIPEEKEYALGKEPAKGVWAYEAGVAYPVDTTAGQKTGFFFDQRENRLMHARFIADAGGSNQTVFDGFSHLGAWGFGALKAGAKHAVFVDRSEAALNTIKTIAKKEGFEDKIETIQGDTLEVMASRKKKEFTSIVIDPPALIPRKKDLNQGSRKYLQLFQAGFSLAGPNATLALSSCSYHMPEERFEEVIWMASRLAGRETAVVYRGGPSLDHPYFPSFAEGRYLKCFFVKA